MNLVNKEIVKKMAKSARKKTKPATTVKKTAKRQTKAAECVDSLLELHKLQGLLLAKLRKQV